MCDCQAREDEPLFQRGALQIQRETEKPSGVCRASHASASLGHTFSCPALMTRQASDLHAPIRETQGTLQLPYWLPRIWQEGNTGRDQTPWSNSSMHLSIYPSGHPSTLQTLLYIYSVPNTVSSGRT